MNNSTTPKTLIIVPFFVLLGLLSVMTASITSCSSSEPRPVAIQEPVENGEIVAAEETVTPKKEIRVKAAHPRQYTVKKGDTLWGISNLFLQDPWYWPEIWQKNNQITNPHLIFPGDVLTLIYVNGRPQLLVNETQHQAVKQSSAQGLPVKKLSPSVRSQSLQASIPSIPGDAIRQFLSKPRVVTKEQLDNAPRIIASDEKRLILGSGDRVYVRGDIDKERVRFSTFNPGDELRDPVSNELLGYEAKYSGAVRITTYDDPASGDITESEREILIGDRLLPEDKSKRANLYFPHTPDREINAQIISLYDSIFGVAQYQIVVINKGERDGMEIGHLLATFTKGEKVYDDFDPKGRVLVKLPDERSGLIMVFKTFDRVSYALTLESRRVIHKDDFAHTPRF